MKTLGSLFLATSMVGFLFACKNKSVQTTSVKFANETDYICGMTVTPEYTDTCHYNGKVYAFCCEMCKNEFAANPETYLKK